MSNTYIFEFHGKWFFSIDFIEEKKWTAIKWNTLKLGFIYKFKKKTRMIFKFLDRK